MSDSGARFIKGDPDKKWIILPEENKDGARRRFGGALGAIELGFGRALADKYREDAEAALARGEELERWPE